MFQSPAAGCACRGSQQITTSLHHCPSNGGPQNVCPLSRSHQGTFLFKASTLSEPNSPRLEAVHCSQWNLVLSNPGWLRTIQEPWPSKDNIGSVPKIPDRNCFVCNCNCQPASESTPRLQVLASDFTERLERSWRKVSSAISACSQTPGFA